MKAACLFAGIGGWELAAADNGIETVWAAEWDEWKAARYRERFPDVTLYGDVEKLDGRSLRRQHGDIDFLFGSPPCTDISAANHKGEGVDGDESRLYFEAVRLADEIRPRWCCFENSDRLRVRGADRVCAALESAGYACWPLVVAAGHAGAPHIRRRSWLVAADAERAGLRDQSGRNDGTAGQGASKPQDHADADGDGQSRLSVDAEVGRGARVDGPGRARDAYGRGIARASVREQRRGGPLGGRQRGSGKAETAGIVRTPCHSASPGRSEWQGVRSDDGQEFAPAERTIGTCWDHAGEGLARHLRMADGLPAGFPNADIKRWRSAYGDAVVVPVVSAIIRGIVRVDQQGTQ